MLKSSNTHNTSPTTKQDWYVGGQDIVRQAETANPSLLIEKINLMRHRNDSRLQHNVRCIPWTTPICIFLMVHYVPALEGRLEAFKLLHNFVLLRALARFVLDV